jgi:L-asparaginase type I
MRTEALEERDDLEGSPTVFKAGTGGDYTRTLQPGKLLLNLVTVVPELRTFANLEVKVLMNKDSCQIGPKEWIKIAKELDAQRSRFDAFIIVHGTDTMAYTASALSLMLTGFRKPIILTGSQLPLDMARSDARQNLIDSVTCATAGFSPPHVALEEVAVCFGGKLLRANRTRKTSATIYSAFGSPQYPPLAQLGVGVEWKRDALLQFSGNGSYAQTYTPRLKLNPNVLRVPIVPGCAPEMAYGDLYSRGVRGIVLEAFGVGNMPMSEDDVTGWIPWLRSQRKKGMMIYLTSQCESGDMHPELYATGSLALEMGAVAGPMMTSECAVVKLMLCLAHPNLPLTVPLAGEL